MCLVQRDVRSQSNELPEVIDNSTGNAKADLNDKLFESGYGAAKHGFSGKSCIVDGPISSVGESLARGAVEVGSEAMIYRGDKDFLKCWPPFRDKITAEDIKDAKEKLDGEISGLIPPNDRRMLKRMQDAVLEGDLKSLSKAFEHLKDDPAKLKAFLKQLNENFDDHNAGLKFAMAKDGSVLMYDKNGGQTAIQMKGGEVSLRPIKQNWDGTVVLQPGEVIGKDASEVMNDLRDKAVRRINNDFDYGGIRPLWKESNKEPFKIDPKWLLMDLKGQRKDEEILY